MKYEISLTPRMEKFELKIHVIKTSDNYLMAIVINVITNTKAQTLPPLPLLLLTISKIMAYHFLLIAILVTNSIATSSSTIVTFTYNTTTITVNWRSSEDVTNIVNTSIEDENVSKIMPVNLTNSKQRLALFHSVNQVFHYYPF